MKVPQWAAYEQLIEDCLTEAPTTAAATKGFYIRDGNTIVGTRTGSEEGEGSSGTKRAAAADEGSGADGSEPPSKKERHAA